MLARFLSVTLLCLGATALAQGPRAADWWIERHRALKQAPGRAQAQLVFLGDSLTQGWQETGQELWQQYYQRRQPLDLGIAGDRTRNVLWRVQHGAVEGLSPRVVVLLVGINDLYARDSQPTAVAASITLIIDELRARLPRARLLLLGIFPAGARESTLRRKIAATNRLLPSLADGEWVHYLDLGQCLLLPDGQLGSGLYPDQLHLTKQGYRLWAEGMEERLRTLLGESGTQSAPLRP